MATKYQPAWLSLEPKRAAFNHPVSQKVQNRLSLELKNSFNWDIVNFNSQLHEKANIFNHYKVTYQKQNFVLHVKEKPHLESLAFHSQFRDAFAVKSMVLPCVIKTLTGNLEVDAGDFYMHVCNFIDGSHLGFIDCVAHSYGYELGRLHQIFAKQKKMELVALRKTRARMTELAKTSQALRECSNLPDLNTPFLFEKLLSFNPDDLICDNPQICHGDLNMGNVIYTKEKKIAFLDFHDSIESFFDPIYDVATACLRYCWVRSEDRKQLTDFFLLGYKRATARTFSEEQLRAAAESYVLKNLLFILGHFSNDGYSNLELQKFEKLYLRI